MNYFKVNLCIPFSSEWLKGSPHYICVFNWIINRSRKKNQKQNKKEFINDDRRMKRSKVFPKPINWGWILCLVSLCDSTAIIEIKCIGLDFSNHQRLNCWTVEQIWIIWSVHRAIYIRYRIRQNYLVLSCFSYIVVEHNNDK